MPMAKATCPECGAKLSSPDGFDIGEVVECPKCETEFKIRASKPAVAPVKSAKPKVVADAEDDEDYEDDELKLKKKKKQGSRRDSDDEETSYKNSPLRFVILGVLVLVMLVGGFFLVRKILAERAANAGLQAAGTSLARTASQTSAITLVAVA